MFYRVTRAAFIGGGRDCVVKNNLFVDFSFQPDSPAWAIGFPKLPLDRIGLYEDEHRAKGTP